MTIWDETPARLDELPAADTAAARREEAGQRAPRSAAVAAPEGWSEAYQLFDGEYASLGELSRALGE